MIIRCCAKESPPCSQANRTYSSSQRRPTGVKQSNSFALTVLTTYTGDVQAARAFKAGASGYLLKNMVRKELIDTIRTVHSGKKRIPPEIAIQMAEHHSDDALTAREIEVLRGVAAGNANKAVAQLLNISEETVKAHMKSILSKLGANDRTHAVTIALKRGIIEI